MSVIESIFNTNTLIQMPASILLFFLINWLGERSSNLGYQSISLFESRNESIALNFIIRTFSPTIAMIVISAFLISYFDKSYTNDIYLVSVYYFLLRVLYIILFSRFYLVKWPKVIFQSIVGIIAAFWAYKELVVPGKPLIPDMTTIGNELWIIIAAFIYTAVNGIETSSAPSARRKNRYISIRYDEFRKLYGNLICNNLPNKLLELTIFSIMIYEDFNRPKFLRFLERTVFSHISKSTGLMQISTDFVLSDHDSVKLAISKLSESYAKESIIKKDNEPYFIIKRVISSYNKDADYISDILSVMEIVAKRIDNNYSESYNSLFGE